MKLEGTETPGPSLVAAVRVCEWRSRVLTEEELRPPASFDNDFLFQQVHLNLLFKMVPYVPDESVRIVGPLFYVKMKTLQVDPSQMESYFEVTIPNSYS